MALDNREDLSSLLRIVYQEAGALDQGDYQTILDLWRGVLAEAAATALGPLRLTVTAVGGRLAVTPAGARLTVT